ncbi:Transcriptional regulator of nonfermentable carbon utilization [Malassezia obtusa]|uniref:Transcriptional regulator of nonfermentable carbon utilization n=1 Tax=Malassezia obtusa TaxID=76774 RepID=A0AAF0IXX4_9BASI|nr:Transcriptional regulator of nonfermentable carbon utilization [Malassezia obtusa]
MIRCIRKGLGDQCVDGYRKKAKYLLEEDDIPSKMHQSISSESAHPAEMFVNNVPENITIANPPNAFASPNVFKPTNGYPRAEAKSSTSDSCAGSGFDPTWLEASILSSMLHDADSGLLNSDSPDVPTVPAMELMDSYTHVNNVLPHDLPEEETMAPHMPWSTQQPAMRPLLEQAVSSDYAKVPVYRDQALSGQYDDQRMLSNTSPALNTHLVSSDQASQADKSASQAMRNSTQASEPDHHTESVWKQRVADVYREDTKPFRYTEGYHILLKYVTQKYEKADVLRIVRALAIFRPSLIALQMALSEEDEKFVERAFQRTMLEFEKLISFSGTPTVVWRRTCEICVVGAEFCKPIPCTWCFTIKRDPFDLPAYVVGNVRGLLTQFLPILS